MPPTGHKRIFIQYNIHNVICYNIIYYNIDTGCCVMSFSSGWLGVGGGVWGSEEVREG